MDSQQIQQHHDVPHDDEVLQKLADIESVIGEIFYHQSQGSQESKMDVSALLEALKTAGAGAQPQPQPQPQPQAPQSDAMQMFQMMQLMQGQQQDKAKDSLLKHIDAKFDSKSEALVEEFMDSMEEGKSFFHSPYFIGGVSLALVLTVGALAWNSHTRLTALEK